MGVELFMGNPVHPNPVLEVSALLEHRIIVGE